MVSFLNYLRHVSWQTSDCESEAEQFLPPDFLNVPGPRTILWESRGKRGNRLQSVAPSVRLPSARPFKPPTVFDVSFRFLSSSHQNVTLILDPECVRFRDRHSYNDIDREAGEKGNFQFSVKHSGHIMWGLLSPFSHLSPVN